MNGKPLVGEIVDHMGTLAMGTVAVVRAVRADLASADVDAFPEEFTHLSDESACTEHDDEEHREGLAEQTVAVKRRHPVRSITVVRGQVMAGKGHATTCPSVDGFFPPDAAPPLQPLVGGRGGGRRRTLAMGCRRLGSEPVHQPVARLQSQMIL